MRRMLDPKEAGGSLPSTITFDEAGNREASKDVKVDGKLKLKSLVSASNPDGDITKELGGGGSIQLYRHHIYLSYKDNYNNYGYVYFDYDSTNPEQFTLDTLIIAMEGKAVTCSGYLIITNTRIAINITSINNQLQVTIFNISNDYVTIQDNVYLIN